MAQDDSMVVEFVVRGHPYAMGALVSYLKDYCSHSTLSLEVAGEFPAADYDDPNQALARAEKLFYALRGD